MGAAYTAGRCRVIYTPDPCASSAPDPWTAGTGMYGMYTGKEDEDIVEEDEDVDVSPVRRVQPHRHGKGIAAPRLSPSGPRRRG